MSKPAFREADWNEATDCDETYSVLLGPDGWQCRLGEPEDRTWGRDGDAVVELLNEQHAEIARLTAEIAAARAVPADVEAAIVEAVDGAEEAGRCSALGHAYLIAKAPFWTVPRLKAAIARAIEAASLSALDEFRALLVAPRAAGVPCPACKVAAPPATVGGLLATAPVGSIVEWTSDGYWHRATVTDTVADHLLSSRWYMVKSGGLWSRALFTVDGHDLRLPARLVPAHLADADPASRAPIVKVAP